MKKDKIETKAAAPRDAKETKNEKMLTEKAFLYVDADTTKAYGDETDLCAFLGTAFIEFVENGTISTKHGHILLDYLSELLDDKEKGSDQLKLDVNKKYS